MDLDQTGEGRSWRDGCRLKPSMQCREGRAAYRYQRSTSTADRGQRTVRGACDAATQCGAVAGPWSLRGEMTGASHALSQEVGGALNVHEWQRASLLDYCIAPARRNPAGSGLRGGNPMMVPAGHCDFSRHMVTRPDDDWRRTPPGTWTGQGTWIEVLRRNAASRRCPSQRVSSVQPGWMISGTYLQNLASCVSQTAQQAVMARAPIVWLLSPDC